MTLKVVVNVSSTLTNTTNWFAAALFHCGRTDAWKDVLPGLLGYLSGDDLKEVDNNKKSPIILVKDGDYSLKHQL